jgi:cation-transporting ATPase E
VVGLVPQGLFLMIAVTYALGAVRLAGKGALVQQANAIESLSNVDVLCLDKTGTLTTNRLKFYAMYAVGTNEERLGSVLGDYVANTLTPNRTAEAIGAAYEGQARRTREEVPFSSDRKWSAIAFDDRNLRGVYVMGAPEMLLPALKQGADWGAEQARAWTGQGLRVVLMAYTPEVARLRGESGEAVLPADLEPLGLVSLSDELRPEAEATLRGFAEAGVRIKIISGDNPDTVAALARQAGLGDDIKLVSGLDLAVMSEAEFGRTAEEATVFGRISPQQKEALVRALKANGHYVAMIGDGVNDVLSLKQSQLGIAMQGGSQATRGVADMVLLNDSFAVLPAAIQEGQRIINGMHDAVRLLLARTMYVMFIIVGASVVGVSFPVTPKHNAILALLTVGIPTLALAAWARPGAAPHRRLIASVANFVVPAGLSVAGVSLVVYLGYLLTTGNVEMARTALTTTATLCGLALIVMLKPEGAGDDWRHAILALSMFVLYIIVLAVPGLCGAFELCAMSALDVAPVGLVVAGWGVALHFAFRKRLFERLVGYVAG